MSYSILIKDGLSNNIIKNIGLIRHPPWGGNFPLRPLTIEGSSEGIKLTKAFVDIFYKDDSLRK